jgi:hypothetical protein
MYLTLSPEEASALRELLTEALGALRSEIRRTDTGEFRDQLHVRERLLLRLAERLDATAA